MIEIKSEPPQWIFPVLGILLLTMVVLFALDRAFPNLHQITPVRPTLQVGEPGRGE